MDDGGLDVVGFRQEGMVVKTVLARPHISNLNQNQSFWLQYQKSLYRDSQDASRWTMFDAHVIHRGTFWRFAFDWTSNDRWEWRDNLWEMPETRRMPR